MTTMFRIAALALAFSAATTAADAACSPERGARLFESKCSLCHPVDPDGAHAIGPNLRGVTGRAIASAPGFGYSSALAGGQGSWSSDRLEAWLADPQAVYPGTAMAFAGIRHPEDRADIVCHLATLAKAAPISADLTRREIDSRMRRIEQLWQAGNTRAMADSLYTDDAIIAGEGLPQPVRGKARIKDLLDQLVKDARDVRLATGAMQELGKSASATWITWTVTPREGAPFVVRSLLIWKKGSDGWRIASDMFSMGDLSGM